MNKLLRSVLNIGMGVSLLWFTVGCTAKARSARHARAGDSYFVAGDYFKAEVEYLAALQRDGNNPHLMSRLGQIYFEQGRLAQALPFVSRSVELSTNELDSRFRLASIYQLAGRNKDALQELDAVLKANPKHQEAPLLLVELAASKKDIEDTRNRLAELRTRSGDSAAMEIASGTLLFRLGDAKGSETAFRKAMEMDPKSAMAYNALSGLLWSQGNLAEAESALMKGAELSPMRSPIRIRYADFKIRNGDLAGGSNVLAQMTQMVPDYLPAWVRLANLALSGNRLQECEALVEKVLNQAPENYDGLLISGRLCLSRKDASKAVAVLERMEKIYEQSPEVNFHLALAYLLGQESTKAMKCVNQALSKNPNYTEAILLKAQLNLTRDDISEAIGALNDLLKREPKQPQAHLQLAAAYRAKGDLESALRVYRRLEEIYPANAEVPMLLGQTFALQKRPGEAREAFQKTLTLAPDYLPALECLVDLDLQEKSFAAAMGRIENEASRVSRVPEAARAPVLNLLRSKVYVAQGDVAQAETALLKAIEQNPESQMAYFLLAQVYVENKQSAKALVKIEEALSHKPTDTASLMLKASILNESRDYEGARATFEKLVAANPNYYPALNNLAYLYSEQFNELDKAFEVARKARDLLSFKDAARQNASQSGVAKLRAYSSDTLGWVVFKRGEYRWALSLLQESAEQLGEEPEVQFHLGMAYYMCGQESRASNALSRALLFNKDFPGKKEAVQRLAILAVNPESAGKGEVANLEKEQAQHPDDPVILVRLSRIYERAGRPEKTLALYEAGLKENPKNATLLARLARLYDGPLRDSAKALQYAKDAYKQTPEDSDIVLLLGHLAFRNGDYKWALSLFEQASGKVTFEPDIAFEFAMCCYSAGRLEVACKRMGEALEAKGNFTRMNEARRFLELAPLAASLPEALRSEARALEVLQKAPDEVPALMVVALCEQHRNESVAARKRFGRILALFPDFIPAWGPMASLCLSEGDYVKAYELATRARSAFPSDASVARTLGIACYGRSDYRNAARLLGECVAKPGGDASLWFYLGMSRLQLNEPKEAKAALEKAVQVGLPEKLAGEAKRTLSTLK
jgi:tetratricopeptide (TPR) repeat protein